jgi:predicted Zn-dependent protease
MTTWRLRGVGVLLAGAVALAGQPAISQVRASERAAAAREHPAVLEQFGGEYRGPQADYVRQVGERMADAAGLRGQCTFTLINSDVVNAFAVPGCYVYVTRGLLSIANSEDELAFVMGHEIGHIAGKHSQKRQQSSVLTGLGALILGAVTKNQNLAQMLGQGAQLYTLKYSRDQEYQADDLGAQYLARAGYAGQAAADMLDDLQRHDQLMARLRGRDDAKAVPQWASTHPSSAERVRRASDRARTPVGANASYGAAPQTDRYLSALDGLVFGDDPEQGFINGRAFAHPSLRIGFEAPSGFSLTNSAQAVMIEGRGGAKAMFAGGRMASSSLDRHADTVLRQLIGQAPAQLGQPQRTTVNGLEAVLQTARVQTNSGVADVSVAAYRTDRDTAYHFLTLAPAGQGYQFDPLIRSMHRLSEREASSLRPRMIRVVTARGGESVSTMARQMDVDEYPAEWFAMINDLPMNATLRAGQRVKVIAYEGGRNRAGQYDERRYDDRYDERRYDDRYDERRYEEPTYRR